MDTVKPYLAVATKGEAILNLIAQEVAASEFNTAWLEQTFHAMEQTMLYRNGVGIAAPQVYISKRLIIVASRPNIRYPDAPEMNPIYMVNPNIVNKSENLILGEEGCLSVPDYRGSVPRAFSITVEYFNLEGIKQIRDFQGFPARIVQHEIDHLDGILFVERIDMESNVIDIQQ